MFRTRCPHCGVKLGDFLYADACPHCHEVLKHNQADQTPVKAKVARPTWWPVGALSRVIRFLES